jgi:hypothetical protein
MSSKKLAERKKQRRAEEKKQMALKRRDSAVQDRKQRTIEHRVNEMMKPRQAPHRNVVNGETPTFSKDLSKEEILARLERNMEILKGLEEEYDKEMAGRQERNQDLENKGISDLKGKMEALHKQAVDSQKADGMAFGGEAEVVFSPNSEEKIDES